MSMSKSFKRAQLVAVVSPDKHFAFPPGGVKPIDRHDPKALSVFLQILEHIKPDIHVDLGDLIHLGYLSHWNEAKGMGGTVASEDGKSTEMSLDEDHKRINIWLNHLMKACRKDTKFYQLEGNHEEILRTSSFMERYRSIKNSDLWYPERAWNLQQRKMEWIPYQRYGENGKNWVDLGKLRCLHGQYANVNHLNKHAAFWPGRNLMYGHMHVAEKKCFPHEKLHLSVSTIGCLCTKYASYHRGRNNAWAQGFAVVHVFKDGSFLDEFVSIIEGRATYGGKVYYAKPEKFLE